MARRRIRDDVMSQPGMDLPEMDPGKVARQQAMQTAPQPTGAQAPTPGNYSRSMGPFGVTSRTIYKQPPPVSTAQQIAQQSVDRERERREALEEPLISARSRAAQQAATPTESEMYTRYRDIVGGQRAAGRQAMLDRLRATTPEALQRAIERYDFQTAQLMANRAAEIQAQAQADLRAAEFGLAESRLRGAGLEEQRRQFDQQLAAAQREADVARREREKAEEFSLTRDIIRPGLSLAATYAGGPFAGALTDRILGAMFTGESRPRDDEPFDADRAPRPDVRGIDLEAWRGG